MNREALHLAQVMQLALREGTSAAQEFPERGYVAPPPKVNFVRLAKQAGIAAAIAGLFAGIVAFIRSRRNR